MTPALQPHVTGVNSRAPRRDSMPYRMVQDDGMVYVQSPMIEELRRELVAFK